MANMRSLSKINLSENPYHYQIAASASAIKIFSADRKLCCVSEKTREARIHLVHQDSRLTDANVLLIVLLFVWLEQFLVLQS